MAIIVPSPIKVRNRSLFGDGGICPVCLIDYRNPAMVDVAYRLTTPFPYDDSSSPNNWAPVYINSRGDGAPWAKDLLCTRQTPVVDRPYSGYGQVGGFKASAPATPVLLDVNPYAQGLPDYSLTGLSKVLGIVEVGGGFHVLTGFDALNNPLTVRTEWVPGFPSGHYEVPTHTAAIYLGEARKDRHGIWGGYLAATAYISTDDGRTWNNVTLPACPVAQPLLSCFVEADGVGNDYLLAGRHAVDGSIDIYRATYNPGTFTMGAWAKILDLYPAAAGGFDCYVGDLVKWSDTEFIMGGHSGPRGFDAFLIYSDDAFATHSDVVDEFGALMISRLGLNVTGSMFTSFQGIRVFNDPAKHVVIGSIAYGLPGDEPLPTLFSTIPYPAPATPVGAPGGGLIGTGGFLDFLR